MSYSQFSLESIKGTFGITLSEKFGTFVDIPEVTYSDFLEETLRYNIPLALAIASEKARSELLITPILVELRKQFLNNISLFSGKEFNVEPERGLSGFCDFLISGSPEQLLIEAPVIALVEAKNDSIESGLGQCMAEMIAAQLFNQRRDNPIKIIYGTVTTGSIWKFMKLEGQVIEIDLNEYFLNNVGKILGILKSAIESNL
ncbi:MAG TPA: hypothetical protein V6D33_03560 [Cyanophyceae cyanobacterium]